MAKVFDSLKVGDTVKIKFKRGGFEKQIPIRKKEYFEQGIEVGLELLLGMEYTFIKTAKKVVLCMPMVGCQSEVMDMIKESLDEAGFSDAQLQKMKKSYSTIKRIDPSSQNYKKLKTKISELDVDRLEQIARAKIRFVSMIAADEYAKKSGKRLHARDYMESTDLEESVKISFHSKGAKTKWMKKQAVASKEIINQTPTSIELPSRWKDLSKKKDHDEIFSVVMENDEYDNEGGMALSQLRTAKSAVEDLMSSIKEMDNLPEWVQSKLTKAVDYMDSVRDYMASEESEEPVNEASAYADARRAFKRDDKRGLAPLKKDTDDSATDSDRKSANKNIIMQMRKAADLPNGADVIFPSGKKKVDRRTAQQVLVKFNSLKKSFEKDKFQKSIRSLSDVKKMIGR